MGFWKRCSWYSHSFCGKTVSLFLSNLSSCLEDVCLACPSEKFGVKFLNVLLFGDDIKLTVSWSWKIVKNEHLFNSLPLAILLPNSDNSVSLN